MSSSHKRFKSIDTNLLHAGAIRPNIEDSVVTPIFQTSTYLTGGDRDYDDVRYVRCSNTPNHAVLHARIAAIESAESALVTASGMAAITTAILSIVKTGDHILTQRCLYGGTQMFLNEDAKGLGIDHMPIDLNDPSSWRKALKPKTKLLYVESISNPLMEVGDLKAIVAFAREHNLVTIIDNTFPSPVNFRPIEIGFDLVVHSATKYLNGHSDIGAGAIVGSQARITKATKLLNHLGGMLDPHACFLLERGMKTMGLRVRQQNQNALQLAQFLSKRDEVSEVRYPGLSSDAGHKFAEKLFDGYGGMLAFYLKSDAMAEPFLNSVTIPLHAVSLGGVESLVVRPSRSSHAGLTAKEREALGVTDALIRVSVGIENIDELIEDFSAALSMSHVKEAKRA
ncbi:MAG: aminotransferase class V-fold PLP-dependent enzyme [candidate division Zixibacteria bacterium]|nr:aminotransferase class V-fold PLP-dependent enzyme [candidate division Zixibacteria bacterium]